MLFRYQKLSQQATGHSFFQRMPIGETLSLCSLGVRIVMRKMVDQPKTTQKELANDLKAPGTTVTVYTIGNLTVPARTPC